MSVVLALVAATVLILIAALRARRPAPHHESVLVQRYVHPGHAWARLTDDGHVVVGVDDFAQSVVGKVAEVRLPRLLKHLRQGGEAFELKHGDRVLPIMSPVSGWVVEKNEAILKNPSLVNRSPYGEGWLFKVKPIKLASQLHNLLTGKAAHQWQDSVRARLLQLFSGTPALMYQDGGVPMDNLCDKCSAQEWEAIKKEFFLVDDTTKETIQ